VYVTPPDGDGNGKGFVRHYMLDFGSTMGSGDFIHGPYRIGHEYIYDGAAVGRAFLTLGTWQRPWEEQGRILYPEIGYYQAELFDPARWKPNYPNLAFLRMDDSDAYWGAKLVTAYSDEIVDRLVDSGKYSRVEVAEHLKTVLKRRRDAIGSYWFDRITPLEDPRLQGDGAGFNLEFRDLAIERGYAKADSRMYRVEVLDLEGKARGTAAEVPSKGSRLQLPAISGGVPEPASADKYGRRAALTLRVQSNRRDGGWAKPIDIVLGFSPESDFLQALGWSHAPR